METKIRSAIFRRDLSLFTLGGVVEERIRAPQFLEEHGGGGGLERSKVDLKGGGMRLLNY